MLYNVFDTLFTILLFGGIAVGLAAFAFRIRLGKRNPRTLKLTVVACAAGSLAQLLDALTYLADSGHIPFMGLAIAAGCGVFALKAYRLYRNPAPVAI